MAKITEDYEQSKSIFSPGKILSFIATIVMIVALPVVLTLVSKQQDIRQRAAPLSKTATISVNPASGAFTVGQQFNVDMVIDGGGQTFNAAQADVSISSNLSVQSLSITPAASGGCNFTFVKASKTPTSANPSFAGAILNGSSSHCVLYTIVLQTTATGTATINLTKGSVKAYENSAEIFLSSQSGSYSVNPVTIPTPTGAPTATPSPTVAPTSTPIPTSIPSPTVAPTSIVLQPPTIDTQPSDTYSSLVQLTGTKDIAITTVFVNGSSIGVAYPTATSWQLPVVLTIGSNTLTIYGQDTVGNISSSTFVNINFHRLGDITGDNVIDLTDLSIFATDWENTGTLNNPLSDMDGDGLVDLTDFSILARTYGN